MAIFFWTGEEEFLIQEKEKSWTKAFSEKHGGDMNISSVDGKSANIDELLSCLESAPFLAEKRLLFIKNLPPQAGDKIDSKKLDKISNSLKSLENYTVAVFMQSNPDKRTSFYKNLKALAQIEIFNKLQHSSLEKWIKQKIISQKTEILPSALSFLIDYVGSDLFILNNEINKLISYTNQEKAISENDIKKVCIPIIPTNVFRFLDAFTEKKAGQALKELENLLQENESLFQLFSLLTNHVRNLIIATNTKNISKEFLIKSLKLHPFVAQKLMHNVKNFSALELKNIYKNLLDIDVAIKTGLINVSANNDSALALEIEKIIIKLFCVEK